MSLLTIILPVFATIGIGIAARRLSFLDAAAFRGLTDVVFYIAMPCLLFGTIVQSPAFDLVGIAAVYFAACLIVFAVAVLLGRLFGVPLTNAAMLGLNSSYGNTVMMGIPVVVAAFGPQGLAPLLAIIALHSAILLPLAGVLIEIGSTGAQTPVAIVWGAIKGMFRNPVIMSILVAFVWRALAIPVPDAMHGFLKLMGGAGTPLALICLGGTLPRLNARAINVETVIGTVLKIAALPTLVWIIGSAMQLPKLPLAVAVLTGGMPTGANAFLLARRDEKLLEMSAATVVATTALSVVTLSVLLYALS